MSSRELSEKYDNAYSAQMELEAEMDRILGSAENRGEAEKHVLKGLIHDINAARGEARKAWNEYEQALKVELEADAKFLAELEAELDEDGWD